MVSLVWPCYAEEIVIIRLTKSNKNIWYLPSSQYNILVPVDVIVTPTKVIRVPNRASKPSGIFWDLLSPQKLAQIRVLRQLKSEIEERDGKSLPSGPDEVLPPTASRDGQKRGQRKKGGSRRPKSPSKGQNASKKS